MKRNDISAFSLVEVALALAVCGFCLVTLLGLLPMGVASTGNAGDEARAMNAIVAIAGDLTAAVKVNGVPDGIKTYGTYGICIPAAITTTPVVSQSLTSFKVTESGQLATADADAHYLVSVTATPPANQYGTYLIRLDLSWPAGAKLGNAAGTVTGMVAVNVQ